MPDIASLVLLAGGLAIVYELVFVKPENPRPPPTKYPALIIKPALNPQQVIEANPPPADHWDLAAQTAWITNVCKKYGHTASMNGNMLECCLGPTLGCFSVAVTTPANVLQPPETQYPEAPTGPPSDYNGTAQSWNQMTSDCAALGQVPTLYTNGSGSCPRYYQCSGQRGSNYAPQTVWGGCAK